MISDSVAANVPPQISQGVWLPSGYHMPVTRVVSAAQDPSVLISNDSGSHFPYQFERQGRGQASLPCQQSNKTEQLILQQQQLAQKLNRLFKKQQCLNKKIHQLLDEQLRLDGLKRLQQPLENQHLRRMQQQVLGLYESPHTRSIISQHVPLRRRYR